jgi:predicted NBD/HSP70 family sugar kinase
MSREGLRPPELGGMNRALVLRLLRQYQPTSRVEVSRRSGLSEGTTSRIVAQLLHQKLVVEDGAQNSTGGRPATRLRLNQSVLHAIGIDIHRWETRCCVGTISGRIVASEFLRTPSGPSKTLQWIADWVTRYRRAHPRQQLDGIGVSARGLVDPETGVVELGQDPSWVKVPVKQCLQEQLGVPVFVENSVRAAAFAEYTFGGPGIRDSRCLLFVEADEGVGFGIVLDGRVYHGPRMAAGEFGQMIMVDSPGSERHDSPGCLERLTSYGAISERYRSLTGGKRGPTLGDSAAQVRRICHRAMEGEAAAKQTLAETCRYLGTGIANVVWGLDAEVIILDGAITEAWSLVGPMLREQFPDGRRFLNFRDLILRPSALRGDATITGAIMLPFASLFSSGERASVEEQVEQPIQMEVWK